MRASRRLLGKAGTLELHLEKCADVVEVWTAARHAECGEQCGQDGTQGP